MSVKCQWRKSQLFDHLVGLRKQEWRHGHTERLGGLEVDNQFELCRLLDGSIARS
jgi:hypothetical protein